MLFLQGLSISTEDILGKHLTSPVSGVTLETTLEFAFQLKTAVH